MGKLDMVFSRTDLPETVESLVESFVVGARYKAFYEKYGPLNARFLGPGYVAGWHSQTHDRWMWTLFAKESIVVGRAPDLRQLKALEGKYAMITYLNVQGRVMRYCKLIMYASDRALHVRDFGADPHSFTLNCERLQRLDLFVDLPIAAPRAS